MAWTNPRSPRYPKSVTVQLSTEVTTALEDIAEKQSLSRAEVVRTLIHDGLRRTGHHAATKERREPRVDDFKTEKESAA